MQRTCGHHAGECPRESTSEGTFCTISGVELEGPALIEYDYSRAGNRPRAATSVATKARRKAHSLRKKERSISSPQVWSAALSRLCPSLPGPARQSLSAALLAWSTTLDLCRKTHPAMRTWPLLFTATVTSHMAEHTPGNVIVPAVPALARHCPDHSDYKRFGISCRAMSVTWRSIRSKALGPGGVLRVGYGLGWKPAGVHI